MLLMDRYLLLLYLRTYVICYLSLAGVLVVVHAFSNLDDLLEYGHQEGNVVNALLQYYGPYLLSLFDRLSGLLALMSLFFVIGWLYRTNEFTAVLAAGIPKSRIAIPLLVMSGTMIFAAAVSREVLIPKYQDRLDRNPQDLKAGATCPIRPCFDQSIGVLIGGRHLMTAENRIDSPSFRFHSDLMPGVRQLTATYAEFLPATESHPVGYKFVGNVQPAQNLPTEDIIKDGKTVFFVASPEREWLQDGEVFMATDVAFELLRGGSSWKQLASTSELVRRLQSTSVHYGDDVRVRVHSRLVQPFVEFTMVLLGLPIVLARSERHLFAVAGSCLFVLILYTGTVMGLQAVGPSGYVIEPALAAWLPLLIFAPVAWVRTKLAMNS